MDDFSLPGYDVDELLGFGGSGEVWRARERATGDLVALKRLPVGSTSDTADGRVPTERLRREAALLASVKHEHVVRLRAVVPTAAGLVLVLDYAEGGSLAGVLGVRGRLSPGEVVTIGAPLAQALSDVHARGLVHGDVTPGNIVFDASGKPLLADLGVASLAGEQGTPIGLTFGYADPALGLAGDAGRVPSAASDVHGLAAVCFSALAGVPPYVQGDVAAAQPLGPLAPGVPPALVAAIEAALDADPAARPDAAAFGRALFAACSPQAVRLVDSPRVVTAAALTHEVVGRPRPMVGSSAGAGRGSVRHPDSRPDRAAGGRHGLPANRRLFIRRAVTAAGVAALLGGAVAIGVCWAGASEGHDAAAVTSAAVTSAAVTSAGVASAAAATASGGPAPGSSPLGSWTVIVGALDAVRDRAFVTADVNALSAVYATDSAPLAADTETLERLIAQGEHARGLQLQLVSVRAVSQSRTEVTLAVRDTLAGYDLVRPDGTTDHVTGRGERSWTVVLHADRGSQWRIASVAPA